MYCFGGTYVEVNSAIERPDLNSYRLLSLSSIQTMIENHSQSDVDEGKLSSLLFATE